MQRLFLDIETCPNVGYFWRTGYNLTLTPENIIRERQIICACWKWEGDDYVYSVDWGKEQDDRNVLEVLVPIIDEADQVVAHNGDRFDVRWIRGRCFVHSIAFPYRLCTFDTCREARKAFNLNSNKLDYLLKLKGHEGKMETGGFQLWTDVMDGNKKSLVKMVEYCRGDVVKLEETFQDLLPYTSPTIHVGVMNGGPRWSCPMCGSENVISNGPVSTVTGMVKWRMQCKDCTSYYRIPQTLRKLMLGED